MEKPEKPVEKTAVIFRIEKVHHIHGQQWECFALFPELPGTLDSSTCTCYTNYGHTSADYFACIDKSHPATPAEYAPLLRELESIGYNVRVAHRCSQTMYTNRLAAISR